jgi:hypothetical protein
MAVGDVFKVSLVGQFQFGQQLVNTFHYRQEDVLILDEPMDDLFDAVEDTLLGSHAGQRSVASQVDKVEIRGVTNPLAGKDFNITPPLSGLRSGEALPPQVSAVVTWTTGNIGRRYRGRTFMWPAAEADQASGVMSAGYEASLGDFAEVAMRLGDGLATAHWQLVVRSDTYNLNTIVTSYVVRTNLHTQRRRVAGVGS